MTEENERIYEVLKEINIGIKSLSGILSESTRPRVIFDIRPNQFNTQLLEVLIKNVGGTPAYDVKMTFEPDLYYHKDSSLSQLPILKHLPFIEQGLEIRFPFRTFYEVLGHGDGYGKKKTLVTVKYYDCASHLRKKNSVSYEEKYPVDITLYQGQLAREESRLSDVVKELRSLQLLLRGGLLVKRPADIEKERTEYMQRYKQQTGK